MNFKSLLIRAFFERGLFLVRTEEKYFFSLKDGGKSPFWFNAEEAISSLALRGHIVSAFNEAINIYNDAIDDYVAIVSAGMIIAASLANCKGKDLVLVREHEKKYGLCNMVNGQLRCQDARIMVIDDMVVTGSAALSVINTLRNKEGNKAKDAILFPLFSMGFQSTKEKLEDAHIIARTVITLKDVIDYGRENNLFTNEEIQVLMDFAKEHGIL